MIAAQTAAGAAGVLGDIIGNIAKSASADNDVPPAKRPYPWEGKVNLPKPSKQRQKGPNIFDLF